MAATSRSVSSVPQLQERLFGFPAFGGRLGSWLWMSSRREGRTHTRAAIGLRGLTQAELARLAVITRVSVNAIEGGRMTPSILLALKLAEALEVPVDELFWLAGSSMTREPAR